MPLPMQSSPQVARGWGFAIPLFVTYLALVAVAASAPGGTTIYVATCGNDTWTGAKPDCAAPDGPKRHIQNALDAASDGDEIIVAAGSYFETIDFNGKAINLHSSAGRDKTTIDANSKHTPAITCTSGEGPDTILDGFTLTHGLGRLVQDQGDWYIGFGMYIDQSSPTVRNCQFKNHHVVVHEDDFIYVRGAAIYNHAAGPAISNCIFSANGASGDFYANPYVEGGAIYNDASNPAIAGCSFTDNRADGEDGFARGAAIYNNNSSPTIVDCSFEHNGARAGSGGGIYNVAGRPTITNCTFSRNGGLKFGGGGIAGGSAVITNCSFVNNGASAGGGISAGGSALVDNCTFESNGTGDDASHGGGGMLAYGNSVVTNCTFRDNEAWSQPGADGGGIILRDNASVRNCTIVDNHANGSGAGIYADYGAYYGSPSVINCTLVRNDFYDDSDTGARLINCTFNKCDVNNHTLGATMINSILWGGGVKGNHLAVTFSDIQGGYEGEGNIAADPHFVNATSDDLRLMADSPCVDAGTNAAIAAEIDADGQCRVMDGDDDGSAIVDMGAYELQGPVLDCNGNGVCDSQESASGDCNRNFIPDSCDITEGTSQDSNHNGIPDECEQVRNVTQNNYWARIQLALDAAIIGDEIVVQPGTYNESLTFRGKAVHLRSASGPGTTTINAEGLTSSAVTCFSDEGAGTVLDGFTLTGAADSERIGGGMLNRFSSPTVTRCVFHGSSAQRGGGMANVYASPTVTHCIFNANAAATNGGGMYCVHSDPTVSNCLFSANAASGYGGGMYCDYSRPIVTSCTFARNSAAAGNGIYVTNITPKVSQSIFWDEAGELGGKAILVTFSDVQGGNDGEGNINADPLFVDPDNDDYRLTAASPCIDAGDPNYTPAPGETDLDHHLRIWDGNADGIATVDMGAYEFGSFAYGDLNCDGAINFDDIDAFVAALTDRTGYEQTYPACNYLLADTNADEAVDFDDIDRFVDCLIGGGCG